MPILLGSPIPYIIYLTDPATTAAYQATYPTGVRLRPAQAAIQFNAPIGGQTPGAAFKAPGIAIFAPPFISSIPGVYELDIFTVPGTGWTDAFGNVYPDNVCYWDGHFLCQIPAPASTPPAAPAVGVRRFICGFETHRLGEGQSGVFRSSRAASRTSEGCGFAYRNLQNQAATISLPTPLPNFSFERLYVRVRTRPTGSNDTIWSCRGSGEGAGPSLHLDVTPAGALALYNQGNGGAPGTVLVTSSVLALETWYRVDLSFKYKVGSVNGSASLTLNGVYVGAAGVAPGSGLGVIQNHTSSSVGDVWNVSGHGLECDLDDWINSAALDPATGSHIRRLLVNGLATGSSAAWIGDYRQLLPNPAENTDAADALVSSTASAPLRVTTDYVPVQKGAAALCVACYVKAGTGTGKLGWILNGVVDVTDVTLNAGIWNARLYTIAGNILGQFSSVGVAFVKDSGAGATQISALAATIEFIGTFGPEDTAGAMASLGIHNAPYPTLAQNVTAVPTLAPVMVQSGVYSGNALGQDRLLTDPAHWWWVRPLASDAGGAWWWSTVLATAGRLDALLKPIRMVLARLLGLSIAGSDLQANAAAALYQWVVVCDPGARFVLNGTFAHVAGLASAINPLQDPAFIPEALFATVEDSASSGTDHWFRGLGHAASNASKLDAAETADVVTLGVGSITSKIPLHGAATNVPDTAYSAWRRVDAGGRTGWFDLVTYVGDGTTPRSIACVLNGVSPLFAIVTPHNGASYHRDPSHLTTHSSTMAGADSTTGIIGGDLNIVKVGVGLNAVGIVYDLFVIGGLPNPGGWSPNPTGPIYPVSPFPPDGPIPPALPPPPDLPPGPPVPPDLPPGGGVCVAPIFGDGT